MHGSEVQVAYVQADGRVEGEGHQDASDALTVDRNAWEILVDATRRPKLHPVRYLRCDRCGKVASRTSIRHQAGWTYGASPGHTAPPEYPCLLCGAYSPRVVGDQVSGGGSSCATAIGPEVSGRCAASGSPKDRWRALLADLGW